MIVAVHAEEQLRVTGIVCAAGGAPRGSPRFGTEKSNGSRACAWGTVKINIVATIFAALVYCIPWRCECQR